MKKITLLFVLLLTLISIAESQIISKTVQFTDSETIDRLTESGKCFGAIISVKSFQ